jgi:hypothetical protein
VNKCPFEIRYDAVPACAIEQAWAKIGTLYIRKSVFERGAAFPRLLRVTVDTAS